MLQIYEIFSNIGTLTLLNFKISGLTIWGRLSENLLEQQETN